MTPAETDPGYRKVINAWCMYDWGNSAFATTILAAVFPIYYGTVAGATLPGNMATAYWAYTSSLGLLMVAVLAPVLGAIADHSGTKMKFLAVFATLGILFTCLLAVVGRGDWKLASVLFIIAYVGFAGSIIFYESLLPHISRPEDIDRVSSKGYAVGYLGGGLLLALNVAWIIKPKLFLMPNSETASRAAILSAGIWWAIFSVPLFRHVAEPVTGNGEKSGAPVREGLRRLARTFGEIRRYKQLTRFLIAFWLYSDGIGSVIRMAAIYGSEIGIGRSSLIGALLLVQFVAIPCTLAFGYLAKPLGPKRAICLALGIYCLVGIGGYRMTEAWHFWALALLVAVAQGGAQALSRSLFSRMVPKAKSAEFFGFFSVSSRFAGIFGPFMFGVVGQMTGSSRIGIVSLLFFFVAGALLLLRVDIQEGVSVASANSSRHGI